MDRSLHEYGDANALIGPPNQGQRAILDLLETSP